MFKLSKLLFIIFTLYCHVNLISAIFYVDFRVISSSSSIYTGSTVTITWDLIGIQTTQVQLGIENVQTTTLTIIDSNVDLTKLSESWVVSVPAGTYRFYFMDSYSNSITSNSFSIYSNPSHSAIPNNSPTQGTTNSTPSSSSDDHSTRNAIIGAVIGGMATVVASVMAAILVQKYKNKKKIEEIGGGNAEAAGSTVYVNNGGYVGNHMGNQSYVGNHMGNQGYMGNQGHANNQGFPGGHVNARDHEENVGVGGYEVNGSGGIRDQNYPIYPPPSYDIN